MDSLATTGLGEKKGEREREKGEEGKRWERRREKQADGKLFWNEVFFEAGFYAR